MVTLKKGSTGADVGMLQQALVEAGLHIDADEMQASSYGASTAAAVAEYQQAHGLGADGVCGPKTWASLNESVADDGPFGWKLDKASPEAAPVIEQACCLVGTIEEPPGSNRGPIIDALNKAAGIPLGSPWCAAFATGMWHYSPSNPFTKSIGSAYGVRDWGKKNGCLLPATAKAEPGDIFVILRDNAHGHVGIVTADLGDRVATVEGNSGNSVKKLLRKKTDLAGFVRPAAKGQRVA